MRARRGSATLAASDDMEAGHEHGDERSRQRSDRDTGLAPGALPRGRAGPRRHYGLEPSERWIDLERPRARLRVLEVGAGDPVIFVHGTGGAGPYWGALVRELPGMRCIMIDRPGWAMSDPIEYGRREYAADIRDVLTGVMDALGIQRAHVAGASIGDVWALRLAQREPSRVGGIGLLGPGPVLDDVPVPGIVKIIASPLGAVMVRMPSKPGRERAILKQVGHGASLAAGRIPDVYVEWRAALGSLTHSTHHERAMIRALVKGRSFRPGLTLDAAQLAGIDHPTLLVYGTADPTAPLEVWQRFVGMLPRGALQLVTDGGHLPWLDDAAGVGDRVSSFLGRCR